jgi:hypothetical protein
VAAGGWIANALSGIGSPLVAAGPPRLASRDRQRQGDDVTSALYVSATTALFLVPGLLIGTALRLRGWFLIGCAPALTVGTAGVLGAWFGVFAIPWEPLPVAGGLAVVAGVAALAARTWRTTRGSMPRPEHPYVWYHHVGLAGGIALAATIGAAAVWMGTHKLQGVHQYWDAMFHANAIRYIADGGVAQSAGLSAVAQPANPDFYYPHTYHLVGAVLADVGIGPAQVVLNTLSACLPALFALSTVALLRVVLPRPTTMLAGALASVMFTIFPYDIINFGPLLPLALALAVAPAVVALMLRMSRAPSVALGAALALGAVGVLTTHPTGAVSAGIMMVLLLLVGRREDQVWRQPRRLLGLALVGAVALALAAPSIGGLLTASGSAGEVDWPAFAIPGSALGQLVLLNHESLFPEWWLAAAVLLGAVVAWRRRELRPFLATAVVFLTLFVLAASYDTPLAQRLTSIWWNDRWRLAAAYALPATVLAAVGLTALVDVLRGLAERGRIRYAVLRSGPVDRAVRILRPAGLRVVSTLIVVGGLLGLSGVGYVRVNGEHVGIPYRDGPTVFAGEREAFAELARLWDGGTILNDPADGSAWAYALEGLPLLFKAPLTPPSDPEDYGVERNLLLADFNRGLDDDGIADAVETLDVRWVIVGEGFASPRAARAVGLEDLDVVDGLEQVWSNGVASIYRVVGSE